VPDQTVILCSGQEEARAVGYPMLSRYLRAANYAASLQRLGFTADDLTQVSPRLFDALIAWGDEEAVMRRVDEHRAAGADQVVLQVLTAGQAGFPREQWRRLGAALT
jgi:probable F420-dependent oxidoreductase